LTFHLDFLRYEWQGKWLFNNFQNVGSLGISSFNDCQERRVTITDPWFRVVDAKAAVANSAASAGLQVWTPEMGSNSWYRWRGYCARPAWGPSSGHKAPPLPWPCPPGNMTFLHSTLWYRITRFVEKWRKDSICLIAGKCSLLPVQVPLFQQMDDLVLNNICERLKPGLFIKDETVGPLTQKIIVIGVFMSSMMGLSNRVFLRVSPGD
jgi:hypothetical protein